MLVKLSSLTHDLVNSAVVKVHILRLRLIKLGHNFYHTLSPHILPGLTVDNMTKHMYS